MTLDAIVPEAQRQLPRKMQEHIGEFMKVRDEFISAPWPAWTAIGCVELAFPGARVEIRVIAGS